MANVSKKKKPPLFSCLVHPRKVDFINKYAPEGVVDVVAANAARAFIRDFADFAADNVREENVRVPPQPQVRE